MHDTHAVGFSSELLVPICSTEKPTALVSCNYHEDHFGHAFEIRQADGAWAHTACVGFGLERIALALFKWHGFDVARWPAGVPGSTTRRMPAVACHNRSMSGRRSSGASSSRT